MKYLEAGTRKTEIFSGAAETGKVLSHHDYYKGRVCICMSVVSSVLKSLRGRKVDCIIQGWILS